MKTMIEQEVTLRQPAEVPLIDSGRYPLSYFLVQPLLRIVRLDLLTVLHQEVRERQYIRSGLVQHRCCLQEALDPMLEYPSKPDVNLLC
ncbi:MAG: hypothetical protein F4X34_00630 [Chloroflexi bacterium]|nr:hypothetical protein [Chloroflexota bacterium]